MDAPTGRRYDVRKFFESVRALTRATLGSVVFTGANQISGDQHVDRRMILPVGEQIIYVPEGKLGNLSERPSGSGSNVAVEERPVG